MATTLIFGSGCIREVNATSYRNPMGDLFTVQVSDNRVESRTPHVRAEFYRCVGIAIHHRLEYVRDGIDRNNQNIFPGIKASLFNRLDRANRHIVVV